MLFEMDAGGSGAICFFVGGVIFAICHLLSFPSNLPNQSSRAVHIYNVIKPPCPSSWLVISNFSVTWMMKYRLIYNYSWMIAILQYRGPNTNDKWSSSWATNYPTPPDQWHDIWTAPCLFICKQATSLMTSSDTHEKHDNIKPWNENY